MKYLLDTDICIYWLKGKSTVRTKVEQVNWSDITICVITATEIYFGAYNSNKIEQNFKTAENFIQSITVLPLSNNTLKKFGQLKAQLRKAGMHLSFIVELKDLELEGRE